MLDAYHARTLRDTVSLQNRAPEEHEQDDDPCERSERIEPVQAQLS
jgi:hypothetical protein